MGNIIVLILISSLISVTSYGSSFMGILQNSKNQVLQINIDSKIYTATTDVSEVQTQLNRLQQGDLIIGQGDLSQEYQSLLIRSIDYVGLTHILGVWLGDNMIFKFKTFNEFSLYEFDNKESKKYKYSLWSYSLSPLDNNDWALFFSDDTKTQLGRLKIKNNNGFLDILDSDTGEIIKSTALRKPTLRQ